MKNTLWVVLFFTLFSCQHKDKEGAHQAEWEISDSATTTIQLRKQADRWVQLKKNSRFEVIETYTEKGNKPMLYRIESEELVHPDSTYPLHHYRVNARALNEEGTAWSSTFDCQEFEINSREIRTMLVAAGTDEDLISLYSLETGKKICSYCYGGLEVMIPNTAARRYFGYTSRECAGRSIEKSEEGSLLGKIAYASNTGQIEEWEIHLNRSPLSSIIPRRTPDLKWIHTEGKNAAIQDGQALILTSAEKSFTAKDISDFSVRMTYFFGEGESTIIEIPVYHDHLDVNRATYDRSLFRLTQ